MAQKKKQEATEMKAEMKDEKAIDRRQKYEKDVEKMVFRILVLDQKLAKKLGGRYNPLSPEQEQKVIDALSSGFAEVDKAINKADAKALGFSLN